MSKILLGRAGETLVHLDTEILLRSKLLLQASSGGGKSRTLRRIAEQAFGLVPVIIIDPEGEFASLRERFDFLLVSADGSGDVPATVETAALLAERILKTGISVVVDLYELKPAERHAWLRAFLDALMNAPRDLWRDYLILIDEAEGFAPESGEGESAAKSAVLDVAKRGRKRGYGLVLATLRVSRLDKSVLAEMQNSLVGLVTMDVDLDRAASAMGYKRGKERDVFQRGLADLEPGYFFARGRAFLPIIKVPLLIHVENVVTTHPEPGARTKAPPPPPPTRIRGLLGQFADLPRAAAAQTSELETLRARVLELEEQLSTQPDAPTEPAPPPEPVEVPTVPAGLPDALAALRELTERLHGGLAQLVPAMQDIPIRLAAVDDLMAGTRQWDGQPGSNGGPAPRTFMLNERHELPRGRRGGIVPAPGMRELECIEREGDGISEDRMEFGGHTRPAAPRKPVAPGEYRPRDGARRMLQALAESLRPLTWRQVATLADVKFTGGTFSTYKGELIKNGCVVENGDAVVLQVAGRRHTTATQRPRNGRDLLAYWLAKPAIRGYAKDMLKHMVERVGKGRVIDRSSWARATAPDAEKSGDGGTFSTYVGILVSNGLVERVGKSQFKAADVFFQ
jgi:hypothetical protein